MGVKQENDFKICPFCAEEIKAAAIKCKHCLSDLTDFDPEPVQPDPSPQPVVASNDDDLALEEEQKRLKAFRADMRLKNRAVLVCFNIAVISGSIEPVFFG